MRRQATAPLTAALATLEAATQWRAPVLEQGLGALLERLDLKPNSVYQPIRVAITGTSVSPGIFDSLEALGRERSLERIRTALARLQSQPATTD